jgi:hypothetical protein
LLSIRNFLLPHFWKVPPLITPSPLVGEGLDGGDESYRKLQSVLMLRPEAGNVIRGSGGLRKIRWNLPGSGKRGSLRIIYYWNPPGTIFMLFPYR